MAMDILGLNPIHPTGEYFRASIWVWYPLVSVMRTTCSDFMSDIFFDKISCNVGTWATERESKLIANRLIQYSEHYIDGVLLLPNELPPVATATAGILDKYPTVTCASEFYISDERLQNWIEFVRSSGGFIVK